MSAFNISSRKIFQTRLETLPTTIAEGSASTLYVNETMTRLPANIVILALSIETPALPTGLSCSSSYAFLKHGVSRLYIGSINFGSVPNYSNNVSSPSPIISKTPSRIVLQFRATWTAGGILPAFICDINYVVLED